MKRDLRFQVTYPHPPERVWRALTEPAAMREWLMETTFAEARVGHQFQFRTTPQPGFNGIVDCEVTTVEPPRRLAYTWRGGWVGRPTLVTYTLERVPEGTRLCLEHTGFQGLAGLALSQVLGSGWNSRILRVALPRVLDSMREATEAQTVP
jgi:uncharacterized protein YndB with AHSA1/START domain